MTTLIQTQTMTSAAKSWLSDTVRALRERLLKDLGDAVESSYRMSLEASAAGLDEEFARKRDRLEAWLDEQVRGGVRGAKEKDEQARERHLQGAIKLAAATFLNRLMVRRQMEALGLARVKVVTGGWNSAGFKEFREFAPGLADSESEGYGTLLRLTFEEMALDLPGLFGEVGITGLIPVPVATLRHTVEALEGAELSEDDRASLWRDDTLLGWTYQFWNDPEREALDEKIRNRGKIENHEIAAKTQLFTDRYMVEWLLQNSLGQLWFAVCKTNGWAPEVVGDGTLSRLEDRRAVWRGRREREEVDLEALMPLETEAEERWKYWVRRDLPKDAAEHAPSTLRDLTLLDPACGSGHFLVIAFDLLVALYEEEARHCGESWSREQIACWIVENNLHGIDIDPRAVQIAAAALWLKVKTYAAKAEPRKMNLVASNLGLGSLPVDDPALLELEEAVESETGIPAELTRRIVESLKGADYLGSLLKVSESIDAAIAEHEETVGLTGNAPSQGDLFAGYAPNVFSVTPEEAKKTLLGKLSVFLSKHTGSADLGLRLRGEQLAAGVRFIRMVREGQYDLVVGNPPYQGSSKCADFTYLNKNYQLGSKDLYACFLLRAIRLSKQGGLSGLLTMKGWMFLGTFEKLRVKLLNNFDLQLFGDVDRGAFAEIDAGPAGVMAAITIWRKTKPSGTRRVVIQPAPLDDKTRDPMRVVRKEAGLLAQVGRHEFTPDHLSVVPGHPLIYWWDGGFLREYAERPKLLETTPARATEGLYNNGRFTRRPWEVREIETHRQAQAVNKIEPSKRWVPFTNGSNGASWYEPLRLVAQWNDNGYEPKSYKTLKTGTFTSAYANEKYFFRPHGVAFAMIGSGFTGRLHRFIGTFGNMGRSIYSESPSNIVCLLNSSLARKIMESLNPGVHFEVGDVNRLPLFPIESAEEIVAQLDIAFTEHEQAREASVEFQKPGPSAWTYAQDWAQRAVDRPKGEPLPPYDPVYEPEPPLDHLSYTLGIALGRFLPPDQLPTEPPSPGAPISVIGPADGKLAHALPYGILFLTSSGGPDSLEHPAAKPLHEVATRRLQDISKKHDLRTYLREKFFSEDHLKRYEKRPIYFPLSSANKNFVAFCSIHRWKDDTLQTLLAEYLHPEANRLSGELADLGSARTTGSRDQQAKAQSRYDEVQSLHQELTDFIQTVTQIAERGAPPSDPKCTPREQDARFQMDLDDGVMINSAALWPLLDPQWKDPKKWWKELCTAKGRKDYDWAHLAARYFPTRVDEKCQEDPSLAVAHGCFWRYHPEKAYQWELRLQSPDELGPDFTLHEQDSETCRRQFEQEHPDKVRELREDEQKRRERKAAKQADEDESDPEDEDDDQLELEEDDDD